jgi:hypothetical protein
MALQQDLTLEQGATWDDTQFPPLVIKNPDGTLYDLTGYTGRSMIRKKYSDAAPVVTLAVTIDIPTATIRRAYSATLSKSVPAGSYVHDLEIFTADDAIVRRVVQGTITVTAEATK